MKCIGRTLRKKGKKTRNFHKFLQRNILPLPIALPAHLSVSFDN